MSRIIVSPLFLLYSPIGLVLVLIRSLLLFYIFIASILLYSLPPLKRIVLRLMCSVLGYFVTYEGNFKGSPDQPLVSNCVTLFDHMGVNLLVNCVTPYKMMMSWALSWRYLNCDELSQKSKLKEVFHLQPEESPIGTSLNSIIKFNETPFKLFNSVQPVAISVSNLLPINLSIHPIDWRSEIFWLLFSPCVQMHVKFLDPIQRKSSSIDVVSTDQTKDPVQEKESHLKLMGADGYSETDFEYAERVRKVLADALGYEMSSLDKDSLFKISGENSPIIPIIQDVTAVSDIHTSKPMKQSDEIKCDNMQKKQPEIGDFINEENCPGITQILAVLPDASKVRAKSLLNKYNGDVEQVISEMIEDPVSSTHESLTAPSNPVINKTTIVAPSCYKIASSNFSRDPDQRHKSFEERKKIFLDNARKRYLEIHGQKTY